MGMPLLRQGSAGSAVKTLQRILNQKEHANLAVDGIFGPLTLAAVLTFQRTHYLSQDGIVGPKTWYALQNTAQISTVKEKHPTVSTSKKSPSGQSYNSSYPILDLNSATIKSYVYAKTNIGGWFFDAELQTTHTYQLTITDHPVQLGSTVEDHAYMMPKTLSMNIGMSDVAKSFIPGQFADGTSRSAQAWKVLEQLQAMRIPIQVYTRLGVYKNMLIQNLTTQDDYTTHQGLKATVNFQELLVAQVQVVKISATPQKKVSTQRGQVQTQKPTQQESLLAQALKALGL